jgi:hypothetical protein
MFSDASIVKYGKLSGSSSIKIKEDSQLTKDLASEPSTNEAIIQNGKVTFQNIKSNFGLN